MKAEIASSTKQIILKLYNGGHINKGVLAGVRTASAMTSPRAQVVWPVMMASMPSRMLSHSGQPTKEETAIYAAVRLYALHQQSTERCVYGPSPRYKGQLADADQALPAGKPLFDVLAGMRLDPAYQVALDRRVQSILTLTNIAAIIDAVSHLIGMLKSRVGDARVDYAQLAQDFYQIQLGYTQANRVRLRWGQQYFYVNKNKQSKGENN
ncbi:type I-E CRISPR-associated protein Cse2/CasB [Lactiplantibacillus modestisalitolerans]|uniref:Type I-E CRISPR-associated protein Cse2/CasB n=1 Tax=Lactiplantibacillus modestisalitolerans TaxID=1457219 RepID=A0ABV5WRK2_9LACO|nr:type I-E CRISPR-associated protein Cse2/CasB [Lactiplantibacillus modestisalitolerans]